eukprot:3278563-Rhodomonas_salina.1
MQRLIDDSRRSSARSAPRKKERKQLRVIVCLPVSRAGLTRFSQLWSHNEHILSPDEALQPVTPDPRPGLDPRP